MSNVEKNKQIKKTMAETKERRKSQKCFVFSTKIDYHKLNRLQKEQLQMLFLEGKWVYNDILNFMDNGGKLSEYDTKKKSILVRQKECEFVEKPLKYLKSSYRDSLVSKVRDSLNSLKELKKKVTKLVSSSSNLSVTSLTSSNLRSRTELNHLRKHQFKVLKVISVCMDLSNSQITLMLKLLMLNYSRSLMDIIFIGLFIYSKTSYLSLKRMNRL